MGKNKVWVRDQVLSGTHPEYHNITITKCHKNTVVSTEDVHTVARSMKRLITTLKLNCALIWLYLQDYREVHDQHNVKYGSKLLDFLHYTSSNTCSKREETPMTPEEKLEEQT
jgi:hypothetical protein